MIESVRLPRRTRGHLFMSSTDKAARLSKPTIG
ncbi:hypothetical protein STENM223S_07497 [Streptomyces tendae]